VNVNEEWVAEGGRNTDVLKEDLKDTTGLLVDQARNTLHTTSTSKTPDSGLCDTCTTVSGPQGCTKIESHTLNIVAKNFAVTLGSTLSESLKSMLTDISKEQKSRERTLPPFPRPDMMI